MDILLSVLIPTLGERKDEFERLMRSVAGQSYKNLEIVVVSQDNHELVLEQCQAYREILNIRHIKSEKKGLSLARNIGLCEVEGEVVVLSDDDCWYPSNAMESIAEVFYQQKEIDVLLTQIFDPEENVPYKSYSNDEKSLKKSIELMSRSSIEIAFRNKKNVFFDELFGLGAFYASGEENDFLIQCLKSKMNIAYKPIVTVYHRIKKRGTSDSQLIAKGALYAKHFGFIVSNLVLLRDLLKKHQNNYKCFFKGYFDYKKRNKKK